MLSLIHNTGDIHNERETQYSKYSDVEDTNLSINIGGSLIIIASSSISARGFAGNSRETLYEYKFSRTAKSAFVLSSLVCSGGCDALTVNYP